MFCTVGFISQNKCCCYYGCILFNQSYTHERIWYVNFIWPSVNGVATEGHWAHAPH